jgi:hypothetical protein
MPNPNFVGKPLQSSPIEIAVTVTGIPTPLMERLLAERTEIEGSIIAMQLAGRMGSAEEIAAAVVWL